jgi:hypothetical protein
MLKAKKGAKRKENTKTGNELVLSTRMGVGLTGQTNATTGSNIKSGSNQMATMGMVSHGRLA